MVLGVLVVCLSTAALAGLALLPLVGLIHPRGVRQLFANPIALVYAVGGVVGGGLVLGYLLSAYSDAVPMIRWGRVLASLLHLLLMGDLFVLAFGVLLWLWPKGGAVALAAFRE